MSKIPFKYLVILVILGTILAVYLLGDIGFAGLLALLFGKKGYDDTPEREAEKHQEMAQHHLAEAKEAAENAEKAHEEMKAIANQPVDYEKPIEEVIENASKDRS